MKNLFRIFRIKSGIRSKPQSVDRQRDLIEFVHDKENIKRAAEGSMTKRMELIKRAELRERTT